MAEWTFIMDYTDKREILIEADTEEEAREKMENGDFVTDTTLDFYAERLVRDLQMVNR